MNKILYRRNEFGQLLLLFFVCSGKRVIFFDGLEFNFKTDESVIDEDLYTEVKYSTITRDKKRLEVEELKHNDHEVFYVKLVNGDIFEIQFTIYGYGEYAQRLLVVEKKGYLRKYDYYEISVLKSYESAETINFPPDFYA